MGILSKMTITVFEDVLAGIHIFIYTVGINLSVFSAEGIHYLPNYLGGGK